MKATRLVGLLIWQYWPTMVWLQADTGLEGLVCLVDTTPHCLLVVLWQ